MKRRTRRKYFAILLVFCLTAGMFANVPYVQAEVTPGEDFQSDLYEYTYVDKQANIRIPEENLQKFVQEGYIEKWKQVSLDWLDIHVEVRSKDTVIPKEILNWSAPYMGCVYVEDKIDGQDCFWRFGTDNIEFTKDFAPQVTFYEPDSSSFSENAVTLGVHSQYSSKEYGTSVQFHVNKFILNEKLWNLSEYFKSFFDTYNTEEIKSENGSGINYSYYNHEPAGEIGWFYISEQSSADAAWKSVTRDSSWSWDQRGEEVNAYVEFNGIDRVGNPDFVISDQPVNGTDLSRLNSFSVIQGAYNPGNNPGNDSGNDPGNDPDIVPGWETLDDTGTYRYSLAASSASITIPEENLQKFVEKNCMEKWDTEGVAEIWLNITVESEQTLIPKEILNWAEKKRGYTTISVKENSQDYEWRFGNSSSSFSEDFNPHVSFYRPSTEAFDEGTACLGVKTGYSPELCASSAKFSVNTFLLDGELINTADFFKNFYDTYNTEEIKAGNEVFYSYSYFNNNNPEGEIGWFYLSSQEGDALKSVTRDSCWTWQNNNGSIGGHVEFNNMSQVTASDFVISDKPVTGTEPSRVNSFSIIYGKSSFDTGDRSSGMYWEGFGDEIETNFNEMGTTLQLNIKDMDDYLENGTLQSLVDENDGLYIELFVYDRDRVIPKEFFNIIRQKNLNVYVFVNLKTEVYEWGLSTNSFFEVKRDFSPYVTYERTRTTEAYFPEGTTALTFKTDCGEDLFSGGLVRKLSLNTLVVDGESQQTCKIFHNFFDKYATPEILQGNMYSYFGDIPQNIEKGYIYLSNYNEERGSLEGAAKDDCWQYYKDFFGDGTNLERAHVEMNDMVMSKSGTFIISDQPPIGSDPDRLHEIYGGNPEQFTEYGTEELKKHFEGTEEIDAKSAASADFVQAAGEMGADISVEKDGVEFTLEHEKIQTDIAFEPDIENGQQSEKVEDLLQEKGLDNKEHDIVSFENAFSREEGRLPGEVDVAYPVDSDIAGPGEDISIYYYNTKEQKLETVASGTVNAEGKMEFPLQHFSQYVIVKGKAAVEETAAPKATERPVSSAAAAPKTEEASPVPPAAGGTDPSGAVGNPASASPEVAGRTYSDAGKTAVYTVTGKGTVTYQKNKKGAKVVIPDTIRLDGHTYKVTGIADKAFYHNRQLKQLVIGKNISSIGRQTFAGCKNIRQITVKTSKLNLKNIGTKAFTGVKPKKVSVPGKRRALYRKWFQKRGMKWKKK